MLQPWTVITWSPLFVSLSDLVGGSFLVQNLKSYKMKDHPHGSAKEAINAFTTGHSRKVTSFNSESYDNWCTGV